MEYYYRGQNFKGHSKKTIRIKKRSESIKESSWKMRVQ